MPRTLWPYGEAERILATYPDAAPFRLETGYGPSGAPHIGTFAEVARTTWVAMALRDLTTGRAAPGADKDPMWEIVTFSDDMDGLRKVPLNMPADLSEHLGKPLCDIPDPFGCHPSYAHHNNGLLRQMLDRYGFRYTFKASHEQYRSGAFDEGLLRILHKVEEVRALILPTLKEENRAEWSPFFPICRACGRIYSTRVTGYHPERGTIDFVCDTPTAGKPGCGEKDEIPVTGGGVKVGWKVDWALRWFTLGIHYEMYGKDLIESADLARKILRILGAPAPVDSFYEMFLDESGSKISKSVGKGLTVETWLSYAPRESMLLFLIKNPRKAKKLSWDVVARSVDELIDAVAKHYAEGKPDDFRDELEFIWPDLPAASPYEYPVTFTFLFSIMGNVGIADPELIAEYVRNYRGRMPGSDAFLRSLVEYATAYYRDHVEPHKKPPEVPAEHAGLLVKYAEYLGVERPVDEIHHQAFAIPREAGVEPGSFFKTVYRILAGQDQGPRLGPFVKMLGQERVAARLREAAAAATSGGAASRGGVSPR
jgi:lysyl-tRNA synthetase class 1